MSDGATELADLNVSGFRTLGTLGRGASAVAYDAIEEATGRRVCVKLFGTELTPKQRDRARLEHEVLAALAGHPHVLPALSVRQTASGRTFMVTELLEGRTLQAEIEARTRLPEAEAIALTLELLDGLAAAHALGVVHRDIKPANLFLVEGSRRRLVVMDFGLAKVREISSEASVAAPVRPLVDPTTAGLMLGTPRYMAPEQILGEQVDARADLYSVGLVLYRLVSGRGPFDDAKGLVELAEAQLLRTPVPPSTHAPTISAGLDEIVLRAVTKRPDGRFPGAAEMAVALRALHATSLPRGRAASPPTEAVGSVVEATRFSADAPTAAIDLRAGTTDELPQGLTPSAAASSPVRPSSPAASGTASSSLDALTEPIPGLALRRPGPSPAEAYRAVGRPTPPGSPTRGAEAGSTTLEHHAGFWSFGSRGRRLILVTALVALIALALLVLVLRVVQ